MVKTKYLVFVIVIIALLIGTVTYLNHERNVMDQADKDRYAEEQMAKYDDMSDEEQEDAFISGSYDDYNPN